MRLYSESESPLSEENNSLRKTKDFDEIVSWDI